MSASGIHTPSQDFMNEPTRRRSQNALKGGQLPQDIQQLENLLLPYDQLLAMGRINPTSASQFRGLSGSQSVLGRLLGSYQNTLVQNDPATAAYAKAVAGGLNLGESGLPADVEKAITRSVRGGLSSRGLLDSSIGAIEEAGALAGGAEAIRAERLGQANQFFNSVTQNAINSLFPNINSIYQGELNRAIEGSGSATRNSGAISASYNG